MLARLNQRVFCVQGKVAPFGELVEPDLYMSQHDNQNQHYPGSLTRYPLPCVVLLLLVFELRMLHETDEDFGE
jgi:hypothetical protein